jgi:hypothetical protein
VAEKWTGREAGVSWIKYSQNIHVNDEFIFTSKKTYEPGYHCKMVYPKVSGLAAWSENCIWYSSLPLGAVL